MVSYQELRLLALVCFFSVVLSQQDYTLEKVNNIFDELEENQHDLKEVIYHMLKKEDIETTTEQSCLCVPFYLCDADKHEVIKDGKFILESRWNSCEDPQDVCCGKDRIGVHSKSTPEIIKEADPITEAEPNPLANPDAKCGLGNPQPSIYSDPTLSKFGEFPWTTLIKKGSNLICAGSLIHPAVVLTSAHCINSTEGVRVRAGDWHVASKEEPQPVQASLIKRIIKHPDFVWDNLHNDVALLIMDEAFELDVHINTVCLAKAAPEPLVTYKDQCVATGWGVIDAGGQHSQIMRKVHCTLTDSDECQKEFRTSRVGPWFELHQSFICAHGQDHLDVCTGNGGAPLTCPTSHNPERFQLVGVTSWGIGCATGLPTVFAKVPQFRKWIDDTFDELGFSKEYYNYD